MKSHKSYNKLFFKSVVFIVLLNIISICLFSQDSNKINELKNKLQKAINDSIRIELLIKISSEYGGSNTDTSMIFATEALKLAENNNNKNLLARCYHTIGVTYYYKSDYNEALEYFFKALKINEEFNNKKEIGAVCNNIGNVYWMQQNLDGALDFYFRDFNIAKELGDEESSAKTMGNIGIIYDEKGDSEKALEYYNKGLELSKKIGDKTAVTNAYINIGVVYQGKSKQNESIKYFLKAYDIALKENNKNSLALIYINIGLSYLELKNFEKAEDFLKKSVDVSKEIGSKSYLSYSYSYLSRLFYKKENYKFALDYFSKSVAVKDSIFNEEKSKQMAEMQTQFETDKKQKQIEIQNLKLEQKDLEINKKQFVIYGTSAGFALMILLALIIFKSYRQKKKSNEIILIQNKSLEQANEEITAQRDEIEAQRDVLDVQNNTLEVVNTKITDSINYAKYIQQAVLPSDIVLDNLLKDYFILFKPKDIVSGDFYWATKINEWLIIAVVDCTGHGVPGAFMSMLGISFLNEIVRKNEVNQASQVLNLLRLSIIDALNQTGKNEEQKDGMDMSLVVIKTQAQSSKSQISSSKLQNEEDNQYSVSSEQSADNDTELQSSEMFIEKESKQLSVSINQSEVISMQSTDNEHITSNVKHQTSNFFRAQWAGANNPLWIVRSDETLTGFKTLSEFSEDASANNEQRTTTELASSTKLNHILFELKPDKMPIAIYDNMESFTNNEFMLYEGDIIYLMTDGYEDAIGGPKGKKFLSKNLKQLIIENCQKSMYEQKEILETTIVNWINNEEQIDDITIMGIKF